MPGAPHYEHAATPLSAPRTEVGEDADLAAITPTLLARVAGAALALAGFFTGLLGVQTASLIPLRGLGAVAVVLMFALGLATLFCGWKVARMRGWAAITGMVTAASATLLGLVWIAYILWHGVVSLLAIGILPLAATACVLAAVMIGAGRRADVARRRLRDAGLEAGD